MKTRRATLRQSTCPQKQKISTKGKALVADTPFLAAAKEGLRKYKPILDSLAKK